MGARPLRQLKRLVFDRPVRIPPSIPLSTPAGSRPPSPPLATTSNRRLSIPRLHFGGVSKKSTTTNKRRSGVAAASLHLFKRDADQETAAELLRQQMKGKSGEKDSAVSTARSSLALELSNADGENQNQRNLIRDILSGKRFLHPEFYISYKCVVVIL